MSIFKGYSQLPTHSVEDGELEDHHISEVVGNVQYNYVPQHGYFFPSSGMNYVIGIDGHRSLVQQKKLTRPASFFGSLFCPCFTVEEPFSNESKMRFRNCFSSLTFLISFAEIVLLGVMLKEGIAPLRENTSVGPAVHTLLSFGAKLDSSILHQNQIWRLFTSSFLHAGALHAIFNLIIQFRLGMYLEREWGWFLFLLTYIASGLGGTVLSCILEPSTVGVGATGAVAGLVTAYGMQVAMCYKSFDLFQRKLQTFQFLTFLIMVLILILCPYVDWSNVLGGGITGMLMGFAIWDREERRHFWIVPALLLLAGFAGGLCYLFLVMK